MLYDEIFFPLSASVISSPKEVRSTQNDTTSAVELFLFTIRFLTAIDGNIPEKKKSK